MFLSLYMEAIDEIKVIFGVVEYIYIYLYESIEQMT